MRASGVGRRDRGRQRKLPSTSGGDNERKRAAQSGRPPNRPGTSSDQPAVQEAALTWKLETAVAPGATVTVAGVAVAVKRRVSPFAYAM